MKKFIAVPMLLFCFNSVCTGGCPEQIKTFYTAYLNNILQDDSKNADLCRTYLTEGLIDKVGRLTNATGADPIIRAQDTTPDAVETLTVEDLGNNWYLVRYFWKKGDGSTVIEIPLKAQNVDGNCEITYITPVWSGSRYGDELLSYEKASDIDQTSALSFLKSFYDAYTSGYCLMPADLNSRLSVLRLHNLSQNALEEFRNAESENLMDGLVGYDMLIDNFDFDCLWRESIAFEHLNGDHYQIVYRGGDKMYKIVITVKKMGGNYLIDGINKSLLP